MSIGRWLLAFIVLGAIGVVVLPSTVSIFLGQHDWYYLENPGSDVPCQKCHADIYEELNLSQLHKHWGNPNVADTSDCEACHRGNSSITYANASAGQYGLEAHAASRTECGYCHFNTTNMHNAVHGNLSKLLNYTAPSCNLCHNPHGNSSYGIAGGFGLSNLAGDSGLNSTHFDLITGTALKSNTYPGESEACVFCHTDVGVAFNVTSYTGYTLTAYDSISGNTSQWHITKLDPSNFTTYREVK